MYHSGQVSSFIVSSLPTGELSIGWIEQGLLGKGFKGRIQDKEIQENLIIPTDRFIRLILETNPKISHGLFILGNHTDSKLVTLIEPHIMNSKASSVVVGFNSGAIKVSELLGIVGQILAGRNDSNDEDVNLDYIEQLISDSASGIVTNLLSISLESTKSKPTTLIKKVLKTDLSSKIILAKSGNPLKISPPIPLLTRWLIGLELFRKTKDAISSLLLVRDSEVFVYLWDSVLQVATFATIEGLSPELILNRYLSPLWFTPTEVSKTGPKVIIEEPKMEPQSTHKSPASTVIDSQSISIVRTRLVELISRFSPLLSKVSHNSTRLGKLLKDGRLEVVDELPYDAIHELRRMEEDTKIISSISTKLWEIEKEFEKGNVSLSSNELQHIVSKMASIRAIIDRIEIELSQLDTKSSEIESLNFKRRTGS